MFKLKTPVPKELEQNATIYTPPPFSPLKDKILNVRPDTLFYCLEVDTYNVSSIMFQDHVCFDSAFRKRGH